MINRVMFGFYLLVMLVFFGKPIFAAEAVKVEGLKTSGYGRAAFGVTDDRLLGKESEKASNGMNIIQTAGNPYKPTGNLGNRGSQAELHFDYGVSANEMNWVTHINIFTGASNYEEPGRPKSSYVYLDEWWVHGMGVFASNPNAAIWMGKRYYGRYENLLNGLQQVNADGTGVGVDNFSLGFGKLNVAVVKDGFGQSTNEFCDQWSDTTGLCSSEDGWGGAYYALVTRLHDMEIIDDVKGDVFANYRTYFGSDKDREVDDGVSVKEAHPDGFQVGLAVKQGTFNGFNRLVMRYGYKVPISITQSWLHIPSYQYGGFFDGMIPLGDDFRFEYTFSHETAVYNDDVNDVTINGDLPYDKTAWNQLILQGTYLWNDRFSTVLELGYDLMDFDVKTGIGESGTNTSYKITLAQDIHIGAGFYDRPVIRFFVTYGRLDTETTAYSNLADWRIENAIDYVDEVGKRSAMTLGVMFETWW